MFVKAIDGIDFTTKEGETLGLVGESGSGKSTTAYNVIGMYGATAGKITFKGEDISQISSKRPLKFKKDIQMVFQDPGTTLNPQRSVRQILTLPCLLYTSDAADDLLCVDLGGRRIIKKKKKKNIKTLQ